jgi:hypothetical protein
MATTGEQFDQATLETMVLNMKAMVEAWQSDSQQQAKQRQTFQDKTNDQYLRFVEDQHTLVMRTADNGASGIQSHRDTLAALTTLILSGEIDTTAQGSMANNLANQMRSVAFEAVQSAMSTTAQTSPPAQGSTGVANSGLQTQVPIEMAQVLAGSINVQTALMTQLAKLTAAVDVLVIKVLGQEVIAEV